MVLCNLHSLTFTLKNSLEMTSCFHDQVKSRVTFPVVLEEVFDLFFIQSWFSSCFEISYFSVLQSRCNSFFFGASFLRVFKGSPSSRSSFTLCHWKKETAKWSWWVDFCIQKSFCSTNAFPRHRPSSWCLSFHWLLRVSQTDMVMQHIEHRCLTPTDLIFPWSTSRFEGLLLTLMDMEVMQFLVQSTLLDQGGIIRTRRAGDRRHPDYSSILKEDGLSMKILWMR